MIENKGRSGNVLIDLPILASYLAGPAFSGYEGFMLGMYGKTPSLINESIAVGGNYGVHMLANRFRNPGRNFLGSFMLNAGAFVGGLATGRFQDLQRV